MGGSLAAVTLPANVSGNTFNADEAMTHFGPTALTYNADGDLTGDGTNTYSWNARNQLNHMSGGVTANFTGACPEPPLRRPERSERGL